MNIPAFTADHSLRRGGLHRSGGIIPATKVPKIIVKAQKDRQYYPNLDGCDYGGFISIFGDFYVIECAPPPRGDFAR